MLPATQFGIVPTDLEFRYLNSKSVDINPDLASKIYGFEKENMLPAIQIGINPNGFGVQVPELQIR